MLGVPFPKNFPSGTDIDTIIEPGVYFAQNNSIDGQQLSGTLVVYKTGKDPWGSNLWRIVQEYYIDAVNFKKIVRIGGINSGSVAWENWHEVSIDYPSFYKDYADLESLKSALKVFGVQNSSRVSDGDNLSSLASGVYMTTQDAINVPIANGFAFVFHTDSSSDVHIVTNYNITKICIRTKWYGTLSPWREIMTQSV